MAKIYFCVFVTVPSMFPKVYNQYDFNICIECWAVKDPRYVVMFEEIPIHLRVKGI